MGAAGGYFIRLESFEGLDLVGLARQALVLEGVEPAGARLRVGAHRKRRVVHLTLEAPALGGAAGARWFSQHPALARLLSGVTDAAVQSWACDPEAFEEVFTWARGRRVGGERLEYSTVDLPPDAETDDAAFERLRRTWPLGHLAHVFGLPREDLLALTRARGLLLPLEEGQGADGPGREALSGLLPPPLGLPSQERAG